MRVPISFALHHPERVEVPVPALDLAQVGSLTFEAVDEDAFPALGLAYAALRAGGTASAILNAANEVAVAAFLEGRLPFLGIADAVEETLAAVDGSPAGDLDDLTAADEEARRLTEKRAPVA
jgi:1-deoxy-D-xylulose-5-phosphate reductoisomerase